MKNIFNLGSYGILILCMGSLCLSLESCCKKHPNYTLTEYGKSWLSSYQNTTVVFKNQFDSVASYVYSNPGVQTGVQERGEGGCSGSIGYTAQYLIMKMTSNDLPFTFSFELDSYVNYYLSGEIPENLTISYGSGCQPDRFIFFLNDTASLGVYAKYLDSVTLNNFSFYSVYVDSNYCQEAPIKKIVSFYFTKTHGIVGFQTDSALWVLQ